MNRRVSQQADYQPAERFQHKRSANKIGDIRRAKRQASELEMCDSSQASWRFPSLATARGSSPAALSAIVPHESWRLTSFKRCFANGVDSIFGPAFLDCPTTRHDSMEARI